MKGIKDRVAVITGGASGIGAGLVRAFSQSGARVVSADISEASGASITAECGTSCVFHKTDLRINEDIDRLVSFAADRFGGIDFVVNAACTYADGGPDASREAWRNGFDINLIGHVMLVNQARPHLRRSSWPSVINFSSESAHVALAGRWVYPATKAALEQVTRSQALDLAEDGIRVNAVMPGWTAKPWQDTAPEEVVERYKDCGRRFHILGRQGSLEEVANVVLFLCSEYAGFVTGACIHVDGGHSALGPQGREQILPTTLRRAAGMGGR